MSRCQNCGAPIRDVLDGEEWCAVCESYNDLPARNRLDDEDTSDGCTNPGGHEFAYTGTAYGGDDPSYHGEGRCYCIHCGADGDA